MINAKKVQKVTYDNTINVKKNIKKCLMITIG